MDENSIRGRKARMIELAALFKEKKVGTSKSLEGILFKFCTREGVKMSTARDYVDCFKGVGLLKIRNGEKKWKYNSEIEMEVFGISI
jgi:hypothetical protein